MILARIHYLLGSQVGFFGKQILRCRLKICLLGGVYQGLGLVMTFAVMVLPCPPPGELPDLGIQSTSPALQADSLLLNHQGSPLS